jgi:hypothetical protein
MSVGARVAGALGRVGATSCYGLGSPLKDAAPSSSGSLKMMRLLPAPATPQ